MAKQQDINVIHINQVSEENRDVASFAYLTPGDPMLETENLSDVIKKSKWKQCFPFMLCIILALVLFLGWLWTREASKEAVVEQPDGLQASISERMEYTTADESEIPQYKEVFKELCIPGYIPEDYQLSLFSMIVEESGAMVEYHYSNGLSDLMINHFLNEEPMGNVMITNVKETYKVDEGQVYFLVNDSETINTLIFMNNTGTVQISVSAKLEKNELEKILTEFK